MQKATLMLAPGEKASINKKLEMTELPEEEQDEVEHIGEVNFQDGCTMLVKLCSGSSNYFLDLVLFGASGHELCCSAAESLGDTIEMTHDEEEYVVNIKEVGVSINNFQELLAHKGHKISVVTYSEDGKYVDNVAIECCRCNEVLMDFDNPLPKEPPSTPIRCPYCGGKHTTIRDAISDCAMGSREETHVCNTCDSRFKVAMAVTKILKVRKAKVFSKEGCFVENKQKQEGTSEK